MTQEMLNLERQENGVFNRIKSFISNMYNDSCYVYEGVLHYSTTVEERVKNLKEVAGNDCEFVFETRVGEDGVEVHDITIKEI